MKEENKNHPIFERLNTLCKNNGTYISVLCKEITGSTGNFNTWKKGDIRNDHLIQIADKFNVSTDYLLCKTDDPTPARKESLSELYPGQNEKILKFVDMIKDYDEKQLERAYRIVKSANEELD